MKWPKSIPAVAWTLVLALTIGRPQPARAERILLDFEELRTVDAETNHRVGKVCSRN
jgi:hypothetical protein